MATSAASIQYCTRSCSQGIRQKERKERKKGGKKEKKGKEKATRLERKAISTCGWHDLLGYMAAEVLICSTYWFLWPISKRHYDPPESGTGSDNVLSRDDLTIHCDPSSESSSPTFTYTVSGTEQMFNKCTSNWREKHFYGFPLLLS